MTADLIIGPAFSYLRLRVDPQFQDVRRSRP